VVSTSVSISVDFIYPNTADCIEKSQGTKRVQMYMYAVRKYDTHTQPAQSKIIMKQKCEWYF
jgi:hypothetical protein